MGFIKNFKRDFAQAVNEIMPEADPETEKKERKKKKKKDEGRQEDVYIEQQGVIYDVPAENMNIPQPEYTYTEQQAETAGEITDQSVREAVSESILKVEAEEAMEKIRQRSEAESMITDEELDSYPVNNDYGAGTYANDVSSEQPASGAEISQQINERENGYYTEVAEISASGEAGDSEAVSDTDEAEAVFADSETAETIEETIDQGNETPAEEGLADDAADGSAETAGEADDNAEETGIDDETVQESEVNTVAEFEAELKSTEDVTENLGEEPDTTYITSGTYIKGDIETDGSIDVIGAVRGNITCLGKLIVGGTVEGDIHAGDVYAGQARIIGEVVSDGAIKVGAGTVIEGNVTATSALIAGAVKGDIDVNGPVIIDSTAIVVGNVKTKSVQVNTGAVIKGYCSQDYAEVDFDKLFDSGKTGGDK